MGDFLVFWAELVKFVAMSLQHVGQAQLPCMKLAAHT